MSKRVFHATNWTPTATADTTNLANGTYQALQGNASTMIILVTEIHVVGLAITPTPTFMQCARDSTRGASLTALASPNSDGFLNPSAGALSTAANAFVAAGTPPQRSASTSDPKLELNLNAFGGISHWENAIGEEWWMIGNSGSGSESSLSSFTGGTVGNVSSHIAYETL